MENTKKKKTKWTYEENLICIESFFKYIDFDVILKDVKSLMLDEIKDTVKDWNIRSTKSWDMKLENINYRFRLEAKLPLKGLENASKLIEVLTRDYYEKSKFYNNEKNFSDNWRFVK